MTINAHSGVSAAGAAHPGHAAVRVRQSPGRVAAAGGGDPGGHLPELPPFCSGAVGYAGYDTVRYFERLPHAPPDDRQVPDMAFAFYDQMVVFDNVTKTIVVVAMARLDKPGATPAAAYDEACRRVDQLVEQLAAPPCDLRPVDIRTGGEVTLALPLELHPGRSSRRPCASAWSTSAPATSSRSCSASGWKCRCATHPFEIYRTLRVVNPSPFMFYVRTPSVTLVGSSPEIMVRVVDGQVTVRPLAGTRRRGADRRGRPPAGRGAAGRSQGAGRARDAGRPGPQRRGPRLPLPLGRSRPT